MELDKKTILRFRRILKEFDDDMYKFPEDFQTDQQKKVPNPPLEKPYPQDATVLDLPRIEDIKVGKNTTFINTLQERESRRCFTNEELSLEELTFLLWSTQGVKQITKHHGAGTKRTVPSGGARHPFETYLIINHVKNLEPGLYRYLALEHKLLRIKKMDQETKKQVKNIAYQPFIAKGAVIFLWAVVPYRMEWRYSIRSSKVIAIEAGHICQNLYLACECLDLGTCAIAAYQQDICDNLFNLDGEDEFIIYIAPVGKINRKES